MVAGWMSRIASRQAGATRAVRTIMKRCQGVHRTRPVLPLCDDKLLTKKRVLRDQVYAVANEIRAHPGNEPKKVDHVSVLHRLCAVNDFDLSVDSTIRPARPSGRPGRPSGLFPAAFADRFKHFPMNASVLTANGSNQPCPAR